jgi:hypothetical protein
MMIRFRSASTALVMAFLCGGASVAQQQAAPLPGGGAARLRLVASFEHRVTGVTVAPGGRIFVNFPRWTEDEPISVAEVAGDGQVKPYPSGLLRPRVISIELNPSRKETRTWLLIPSTV